MRYVKGKINKIIKLCCIFIVFIVCIYIFGFKGYNVVLVCKDYY